jgi:hypothetical protein
MKARYPANWKGIREAIRERAGDRCEWCGIANRVYVIRDANGQTWDSSPSRENMTRVASCYTSSVGPVRVVRIVCTVAHVHDKRPEACDPSNLAFLCQRCHNRHDAKDRAANAKATRSAKLPIAGGSPLS